MSKVQRPPSKRSETSIVGSGGFHLSETSTSGHWTGGGDCMEIHLICLLCICVCICCASVFGCVVYACAVPVRAVFVCMCLCVRTRICLCVSVWVWMWMNACAWLPPCLFFRFFLFDITKFNVLCHLFLCGNQLPTHPPVHPLQRCADWSSVVTKSADGRHYQHLAVAFKHAQRVVCPESPIVHHICRTILYIIYIYILVSLYYVLFYYIYIVLLYHALLYYTLLYYVL